MNQQELFVKMTLSAWQTQNERVDKLLDQLSDAQLHSETAEGRNTGIYLIGHLTAVNDAMIPLLNFGERLYPQLDITFIKNPDKTNQPMPSIPILKECWKKVNSELGNHMKKLSADDWFAKHTSVSEEDFAKEPHRNKLNIILNRTNHQSYHLGQLIYLLKK